MWFQVTFLLKTALQTKFTSGPFFAIVIDMSTPSSANHKLPAILAWLCIGIGSYILLLATKVIPVAPQDVHVPMPIFFLVGLIFVFCGIMILLGQTSKYNDLTAALLLACFACIGAWISLLAPPEGIQGGLPFLPATTNAILGKTLIGLGSVLCMFLSAYAFKLYRRKNMNQT